MSVRIEVISAPGCGKCSSAQSELRAVALAVLGDGNVDWRELSVLEHIDYAVSLGVLSMPAIAVDGSLVFPSLPSPERFREVLSGMGKG